MFPMFLEVCLRKIPTPLQQLVTNSKVDFSKSDRRDDCQDCVSILRGVFLGVEGTPPQVGVFVRGNLVFERFSCS